MFAGVPGLLLVLNLRLRLVGLRLRLVGLLDLDGSLLLGHRGRLGELSVNGLHKHIQLRILAPMTDGSAFVAVGVELD